MSWTITPSFTQWTPALISTALWLDATDSSTITLNGSTVSEWRDKSGNSRHASQSTAANQPTYSATGFNSRPTIQFDGINDELNLVQFAQVSNQNIFAVVDTVNLGTDYREFLGRTSGTANNLTILLGGASNSRRPCVYWNGDRALSAAVQRKAIIRWSFATGSPASALTQVDGGPETTATFTASELTNWNNICRSPFQQADVDVSEIVMTPSTVSTLNRQKLEGYLAHKWGLTANLPSNHPYKVNPPAP